MKDSAKTILCYGDSNTWGAIPRSNKRYPRSQRWTNILQNLLGEDFEVISEGLPGRIFASENISEPYKNGITQLNSIIETHYPIDLLIIMLGSNDIQSKYNLEAKDIADNLKKTLDLVKKYQNVPKILVVCPAPILSPEKMPISDAGKDMDREMKRGIEIFKTLPQLMKKVAESGGVDFINAGEYISSSRLDGCHLDTGSHKKLAEVLQEYILNTYEIKN